MTAIVHRDVKPENVSAAVQCTPLALSAWVDDPAKLTLTPAYVTALRALPLTGVAVMLDSLEPGLGDVRWSARDLERLRQALPDHERTLTLWGTPQREHIGALAMGLAPLLDALGTRRVEVDLEGAGRWRRKDVRGYADLAEAGTALVHELRHAGAEHIGITTFPGMLDACGSALAGADALALQVYATSTSGHSPEWTGQRLTAAIARYPHLEVIAGVAAYRQPGKRDEDRTAHMRRCLGEASRAGCGRARLWSVKHLCRMTAKSYAVPALG